MQAQNTLELLRRDGCASLLPLDTTKVVDIYNYLLQCPVYNAHVRAKSSKELPLTQAFGASDWPMFCHDMEDAVLAPHFFDFALTTFPLAKEYFDGNFPLLYSMNAFWTQPHTAGPDYMDTHGWHRDGDGKHQLVLFMFGTDVLTPEAGAHQYQRGSHKPGSPDNHAPPPEIIETFTGKAGTMFMVDTNGMHIGWRPGFGKRLLIWARWGTDDPPVSYGWDRLTAVNKTKLGDRYPADAELRHAIHLVAA